MFEEAVAGGADAPKQPLAAALGRLLDRVHMAVLLVAVRQDAAPLRTAHRDRGHRPTGSADRGCNEHAVVIGCGDRDFQRARSALAAWKHFDIGWLDVFPRHASVEIGADAAVLIRRLGVWSLNGARVLYHVAGSGRGVATEPIGPPRPAGRHAAASGGVERLSLCGG